MRYTYVSWKFLAIAHHQNLTKAADELAMSQSAASSALKDLEERFSTQLFDRIGVCNSTSKASCCAKKPRHTAGTGQRSRRRAGTPQRSRAFKRGATLSIGNYLAVGLVARYMADYPLPKSACM